MFSSIRGQDDAIRHLELSLNNPVNTYVFYSSRGTYAEEAARIFAARLVDPSGDSDSRVEKQIHPDVIEYEPMGTQYRVKEDVRESMMTELRKSPIESSAKVLIVHDAHLLREDSANTLLKSLEEPPINVHWILLAPQPDSLISTIRSRSFPIHFSRLNDALIQETLINEGFEQSRVEVVTPMAAGRIDRARNLAGPYFSLVTLAQHIADNTETSASFVTATASNIVGYFDEIASDVTAKNKKDLETIKKETKDSGYSDKIAQSIVTATKNRFEAKEKRLRNQLLTEFLDVLNFAYGVRARSGNTSALIASHAIDNARSRLIFNPSEVLFLESLLVSVSRGPLPVNS